MPIAILGTTPALPTEWWPALEAGGLGTPATEAADFSFDATALVTVNGAVDPIVGLSLAVAPSGAGEVTATRLQAIGTLAVVWLTGGVAGRTYTYQLAITTAAGRTLVVYIGQVCDPVVAYSPVPPPPSPAFALLGIWP